jgi:hypothetical protein
MRRRLSAVVLGLMSVFVLAGPVFADTVPGPGNYRDSGSTTYLNAWASVCGRTTCTDTNVWAYNTELQSGDSYVEVCADQFTYPIRGGGKYRSLSACAPVSADIAGDLSAATIDATLDGQSCNQRTCTSTQVSLSLSLSAVSASNSYSRTEKYQYGTCIDTYRVRGQSRDAEGSLVINGSTLDAFGQIASESFAFSTRCR